MRLFGYYALHTFKNQLRKLFKTWVLIFLLVCFVIGGLIGFGAAKLEDAVEPEEPGQVEVIEEPEEGPSLEESIGIDAKDLTELIAGVVVLGVLLFEVMSADKSGSRIFLPADVNLLFASPLRPQSVLMFRLATQLGTGIFAGLYMLFQLPNLLKIGLGLWGALSLVGAWMLTILLGRLLQVLVYTLCSGHPGVKPWVHRGVYLVVGAALVAHALYWQTSGLGWLPAAARFFNSTPAHLIPLWGWVKGFIHSAINGSAGGVLLYLGLCALGGAVLAALIYRVKADFYEDAMARSEETAELLERARSEKSSGLVVRRKKDRADTLRRDGFDHGRGASVFFHKALYNRFRFAHLGFLTKTIETYVAAALLMGLFCRYIAQSDSAMPVALLLAAFAFFRALGNPLEEDTRMDFFRLIPESMWAKLFFSLLGGTVNCLLDVLPALLLGWLVQGALLTTPATALAALALVLLIMSVDFYATAVGTFIDLSTPAHAGKTVKQLVQVMFIYFGLLPDVIVIAVGLVLGGVGNTVTLWVAALLNVGLGLVFFFLSPLFLLPKTDPIPPADLPQPDLPEAKRRFSRLGLGAFVFLAATTVAQIVAGIVAETLFHNWQLTRPWLLWPLTFLPEYLIGLPLGLLVMRGVPAAPRERRSLKAGEYLPLLPVCVFLMYAGNLISTVLIDLLSALFPVSGGNPVTTYATDDAFALKVLCMVILAPVMEELVFRKVLIDRMGIYGEKLAVVVSAAMFGLFHGNLSQSLYAFALGLLFGYVYLKTGKLRYSIGLHMFINCVGSVIGPAVLEGADLDVFGIRDLFSAGNLALFAYLALLLGLSLAGLVLLAIRSRRVTFDLAPQELPRGKRFSTVWLNLGMILFLLACLGLIVLSMT